MSGMTMTVPAGMSQELLQKAATADRLKLVRDVLAAVFLILTLSPSPSW
jgi:hypothetical protein